MENLKILIKNPYILTMNKKKEEYKGNILIENDRLKLISKDEIVEDVDKVIEAEGLVALPGFIQPHIHLCQTLFRGTADDMELMDWLKLRIWPLEGAHDEESIYDSANLGIAELIKGGTTTIVDMETVHHTSSAIKAIEETGLRAITGKVMMDYGKGVPPTLKETTRDSLDESVKLLKEWHTRANGRIEYAFCPRFVVSCTEELLLEVSKLSKEYGVKVHTHASENLGEIGIVESDRGMRNISYLKKVNLLNENLILAHCIWLQEEEIEELRVSKTKVAHCPNSNTKLSSGVAKVSEFLELGIDVGIAADGAPCNNNLDMFQEMRMASSLQKLRLGSKAMDCKTLLYMATMGGAKVIKKEDMLGSLEEGKKADLILMDLNRLHSSPSFAVPLESRIVFSAKTENVHTTIVDGKILMENRILMTLDERSVIRNANRSIERLRQKINI